MPQTKYCDPRCACVPRVNKSHKSAIDNDSVAIYLFFIYFLFINLEHTTVGVMGEGETNNIDCSIESNDQH